MIMCWFTPKSFDGSSEKFEIVRFGLWSQSTSDSNGLVENDAADVRCPDVALYSNGDDEKSGCAARKGETGAGRESIERLRNEAGSQGRGERRVRDRQI